MTERGALSIALVLNLGLALAEMVAAVWSRSVALMADAIDFVEDSVVYALALAMRNRTAEAERRFGLLIAGLMCLPAIGVLWQIWRNFGTVPKGGTIWAVSALALVANLVSAMVILRARRGPAPESLGLRAAWLSSRNDALANVAMIAAGVAVLVLHSGLPDLVVGLGVAALHVSGGVEIAGAALRHRT